jgi:hypothetical protein
VRPVAGHSTMRTSMFTAKCDGSRRNRKLEGWNSSVPVDGSSRWRSTRLNVFRIYPLNFGAKF